MPENSVKSAEGINLATKYEKGFLAAYTRASVLQGKTNTDYSWNGVNSIHVYSIITQPLNDYKREGLWRYSGGKGPQELKDTEQELIIKLDKGFQMSIDNGNNDEQMNMKEAGRVIKQQVGEQVVPWFDKYDLNYYADNATNKSTDFTTLTSANILDLFVDARSRFENANIPESGRYAYVTTKTYGLLLKEPNFLGADKLNANMLTNGVVGKVMGFYVVEVPDSYITNANVLVTQKRSIIAATKAKKVVINSNDPNIDGKILSGRYRGDAFILDTLKDGVIAYNKAAA